MEYSCVQLNDLPDEILMIILKKLNNIDVLYSLFGVNKRLNKILSDSLFTNRLTLLISLMNHYFCSLPNPILDQFCLQILPKIHDKIQWLDLEPFSMERILLATNYPNLFGFGLYNIQEEVAIYLFNDESPFTRAFKNQIASLVISINTNGNRCYVSARIFTRIINTFIYLRFLNFCPFSSWSQELSFGDLSPTFSSSTLLELHVCLKHFTDCLYLLDGRFNQLRILHVNINFISSKLTFNNQKTLPNLRSFSLYCKRKTNAYDKLLIPLLHRMSDVEKLNLSLIVAGKTRFIDGNDLKINILHHMPLLDKFTFNIRSFSRLSKLIDFPSNEDIQHTFNNFRDNQIISCVDYFQERRYGQCQISSYPYQLKHYNEISNNYPDGIFQCVERVSLYDERPFEHEFFLRIEKSFPLMTHLTVVNRKQQNQNQDLSIIKYPHLMYLNLIETHEDYLEQFFLDTKMCLQNHIIIEVDYQLLKKVTHNFTRNAMRNNCAKLRGILFIRKSESPEHLQDYFPIAKIP